MHPKEPNMLHEEERNVNKKFISYVHFSIVVQLKTDNKGR